MENQTFFKKLHVSWFQQLRNKFSPTLVNTTSEHVYLLNQKKRKVPMGGKFYPKTFYKHDLCYQCSVDGPELLYEKLRIKDRKYEPYFILKIEYSSNNMFQTAY